ncbi:hypothetical protein DICSQDRAFT_184272 [Dichomitus squalens LYAD-421 SS1]|uniref:Uncharacterized protein n=1 Tax=Dichomitus squalens (strain LYAD-421) TaxID=732165 RepID=R7SKD7_DICSQ|nr:uncharacterized protein DICSQDRAFT_184272 [Dichomitus squalens LYAD-421 SS1]EJF55522.1 hypothetical protein DICSQDRAFT_184272 [Dichomitus squalens LYAD-421 SS1]
MPLKERKQSSPCNPSLRTPACKGQASSNCSLTLCTPCCARQPEGVAVCRYQYHRKARLAHQSSSQSPATAPAPAPLASTSGDTHLGNSSPSKLVATTSSPASQPPSDSALYAKPLANTWSEKQALVAHVERAHDIARREEKAKKEVERQGMQEHMSRTVTFRIWTQEGEEPTSQRVFLSAFPDFVPARVPSLMEELPDGISRIAVFMPDDGSWMKLDILAGCTVQPLGEQREVLVRLITFNDLDCPGLPPFAAHASGQVAKRRRDPSANGEDDLSSKPKKGRTMEPRLMFPSQYPFRTVWDYVKNVDRRKRRDRSMTVAKALKLVNEATKVDCKESTLNDIKRWLRQGDVDVWERFLQLGLLEGGSFGDYKDAVKNRSPEQTSLPWNPIHPGPTPPSDVDPSPSSAHAPIVPSLQDFRELDIVSDTDPSEPGSLVMDITLDSEHAPSSPVPECATDEESNFQFAHSPSTALDNISAIEPSFLAHVPSLPMSDVSAYLHTLSLDVASSLLALRVAAAETTADQLFSNPVSVPSLAGNSEAGISIDISCSDDMRNFDASDFAFGFDFTSSMPDIFHNEGPVST